MSGSHHEERETGRRFRLASSGLLTALILAVVLGALGFVWVAHLRGRLHKFSTVEIPPDVPLPRPGGQDVMELQRISPASDNVPQFVGLTMMPGVGMSVLNLSLDLPGRDPMDILNGTPIDKLAQSLQPYTNAPKPSLQYSPISLKVFPLQGASDGQEVLGMQSAQEFRNDMIPGGTGASADFAAAPPPGPTGITPRPSGIQTKVAATISDRGYDLSVSAKNVSQEARAVVISWTPHFAIPPAGLGKLRVVAPETLDSDPSMRTRPEEVSLGSGGFQRSWSGLRYSYLSMGPELRLHNLADGYTLNMIALTSSIRTIRMDAPAGANFVSMEFSTEGPGGSRTVIEPGETLQWHLRLQASPSNSYTPAPQ